MNFREGSNARLSKDDIEREFEQNISHRTKDDVPRILRKGSRKRVQFSTAKSSASKRQTHVLGMWKQSPVQLPEFNRASLANLLTRWLKRTYETESRRSELFSEQAWQKWIHSSSVQKQ